MTESTPAVIDDATPAPKAPDDCVASHLRCISCQYDLHGLALSGNCSECGWPIADTLRASELDHVWLLTIRTGLRWLTASMYIFAFLVATRFLGPMDYVVLALLHLGAAVNLITPNPNRPPEHTATRWPPSLIGIAIGMYLVASSEWIGGSYAAWLMVSIAGAIHSVGVGLVWWRIQALLDQGIAPKSAIIARNLAWLTIVVGALTFLPTFLYMLEPDSVLPGAVASGIHLLWLLSLVVWLFASVITLHLTSIPLRRLIALTEPPRAT